MRTTILKIEGKSLDAVLVAGGQGFKLYSLASLNAWGLKVGRKVLLIDEEHPKHQLVSKYSMLKYQPAPERSAIQADLIQYIREQA